MTTTPNYSFPLIAESQTNKFLTHNDAISMIDTVINGVEIVGVPTAGLVYSDGTALQTAVVDPTLSYVSGALALNLAHTNAWTKSQRVTPVTLGTSGSITPDFSASNNFSIALAGNATLANATNANAGQAGQIVIVQGGSHTFAFGSAYKFPGGIDPVVSSGTGAIDVLSYYVVSSTSILVSAVLNFS